MFKFGLCCFIALVQVQGLHLPDYIKPCHRSDPNFGKCATDAANAAIPQVANGDRKYGSLSVKPLRLPSLEIATDSLTLKFLDFDIFGFDKLHVTNISLTFEEGDKSDHGVVEGDIKELHYKGKYSIDGQILILPIKGEGDIDAKFIDGHYQFFFELQKYKKDGTVYVKLVNPKVKYTLGKAEYHLDNLFNGDKTLGDNMNKVLNENWVDVNKDLEEAIAKPMAEVCAQIANAYYDNVPYDEIYLP